MISSFRRYLETWYARLLFLLMVAAFILWGVGDMLRVIGTTTWVAKVGDTTIEAQTMEPDFRRALAAASRNLPSGQEPSAQMRREVGDETLQRLIGQAALTQELASLHIVVPEAILLDTVRKLPAFKGSDGKFDKARFDEALRANGLTEPGFLELMRGDIARQELMGAVTAGARVPGEEAAPIYSSRYEKRSADLAAFPVAAMPAPPVPDEAVARRWYDNHPDVYVTPEYRRVKVIVLSPATLAADVTVSDSELQAAYEEHKADYTTIAKRSAEVISTTDEAKAAALAEQWRGGAAWVAMQAAAQADGAAAIEEDDATATQFPDPDLAKAVFSAAPDTVPPPIKGALGWFVIKVTKAVAGGTTPFDQVKDDLRKRVEIEKAIAKVYDAANKIDNVLGNGGSLDTLPPGDGAVAATVTLDQLGNTPEGAPAVLPGEPAIRSAIITAAFAAQKGDQPQLTEVPTPSTGGSGYYALSLLDVIPAGKKPFEAVREEVSNDWRADQRRHSAEVAASAMLAAVKGGKSFSDAARDAGVTPRLSPLVSRTDPDPAMPREVQQVLFSLKKGEPTMVENAEGFLVATPVEIVSPDPAADPPGYEQFRTAIDRTMANDMDTLFSEALRQRANPRINQANFDQVVQP